MKNRKFKIGICFSLLSILTVGAACFISSDPSVEYFGNEEVNTSNDLKVVISTKENALGDMNYPYYFPVKLQKGHIINLKGREIVRGDDPSKHIFKMLYPRENLTFSNMRDEDLQLTDLNKIDGITSITVDYDYDKDEGRRSDVRLHTWFEGDERDDLRAQTQILKPGVPATFKNLHPCYFDLDTVQSEGFEMGIVNVKSITITYTCEKTVSPYSAHNTYDFDFDKVNKTATLISVKDPEKLTDPLKIPSHVAAIGDPNTLYTITKIGNGVFDRTDCSQAFSDVILPDTITEIGDSAFARHKLNSINMPKGLKTIGEGAFESSNLMSIDLSNVTTIGNRAFYGCTLLQDAIDISNVTKLGTFVFTKTSFKKVTYSNYLTTVPSGTFKSSSLRSITLDDRVTSIGDSAFNEANLHDFVLPNKLISIGESAFAFNDYLIDVTLPASVTTVGSLAFTNKMYDVKIHVPFTEGNTPAGFASNWAGAKTIIKYAA